MTTTGYTKKGMILATPNHGHWLQDLENAESYQYIIPGNTRPDHTNALSFPCPILAVFPPCRVSPLAHAALSPDWQHYS